jgi:hypothetical protein
MAGDVLIRGREIAPNDSGRRATLPRDRPVNGSRVSRTRRRHGSMS